MNFLEKSILATVCYYDIFEYPLTPLEVFKYLVNPLYIIGQTEKIETLKIEPLKNISLFQILDTLESKRIKRFISQKNGFYFLKGGSRFVETRIERQKIAAGRWKKINKVLKYLQAVPFVKMIAVCNSLAIDNSKEEADIDFFLITRRKRIWLVRFLVTLTIWLMGEWRHKNKISGRICLSFYIADDLLNLKGITIQPFDTYLAHWICELRPILCEGKIYEDFILANQWVRDYLLNFGQIENVYHPPFKRNKFLSFCKKILEKLLDGWVGDIKELVFKFFQKIKISRSLHPHEVSTAVIISDKTLKFHENDRRRCFQEEFLKRINKALSVDKT